MKNRYNDTSVDWVKGFTGCYKVLYMGDVKYLDKKTLSMDPTEVEESECLLRYNL